MIPESVVKILGNLDVIIIEAVFLIFTPWCCKERIKR